VEQLRPAIDRDWLTVREAVEYHLKNTPRQRPIHRSAVYRWTRAGRVPGEWRGGRLYINRQSLEAFCLGHSACRDEVSAPSDSRRGNAAADRLRTRHGIPTPKKGGLVV
jgi:hypothetical protein